LIFKAELCQDAASNPDCDKLAFLS